MLRDQSETNGKAAPRSAKPNKLSLSAEGRFITVKEFAEKMSITVQWAYVLINRGEVPIRPVGSGRYRVDWQAYCDMPSDTITPAKKNVRELIRAIR